MRRAIRLIAGLSFVTLLGACMGNSVNAQETNTRQPAVQVTRQPAVQVSRQPAVQVTRQGGEQVTRQGGQQVTRTQTWPPTQSRADEAKGAIDYQMDLARKRFLEADMDARCRDRHLRQKEGRLPRSDEALLISPLGKQNRDGSVHRLKRDDQATQ